MHPRWHSDQPGPPVCPKSGAPVPGEEREDYINAPLPNLEHQLTAELSGASWTVVTFAPEDALWCDWIYRNLNGYPLPVSLVDRVTPHGFPRPGCLSVFPDRQDPGYAERFPHALSEGVYLVVVCSAQSARTPAVDEHIAAFKKAGGEERIVALVVDGPPDPRLGERLRAPLCDWLPAWLRWRVEENGFRAADRSEPRVVDARRGYRSLKQVRDGLLTALVDMDAAELERLGGCNRPVESVSLRENTPETPVPIMSTAVATAPPIDLPRRGSRYTIWSAFILILVAVVFGLKSFNEITADEPASTLDVGPITGVLAGRSTKAKSDDSTEAQAASLQADAPSEQEAATVPVAQTTTETSQTPPSPAAEPAPAAPSTGIEKSNVAQITPVPIPLTTRIVPSDDSAHRATVTTVLAASVPPPAPAPAPANSESDAVLLDEVHTLERRGDETMAERRTEDALDLYHTALASAEEYAARKNASPASRDQIVALERKLGMLQVQNSSTAEARATYQQARKNLLLLKSQGQWSRERAKALDEIESRLLSLPRD